MKEWLTAYVLGIRMASPGYRTITIEPGLTAVIERAKGSVSCPYGTISMEYTCSEQELNLIVQIPVGTTADIGMPVFGEGLLSENDYPYTVERRGQTCWILNVGSGQHHFTIS